MSRESRKSAQANPRTTVRLSVPVDVRTHARLIAAAALRGVERSELAAGFIRDGLKGVVVTDPKGRADLDGENEAA